MTARVIQAWTEDEAAALQKTEKVYKGKYVVFQPWIEDDKGYHCLYSNKMGNAVFVNRSRLQLGHPKLRSPRIVGPDRPFNLAKVRGNLDSPLARFLESFRETCIKAEESLVAAGIIPMQMTLLKKEGSIKFMVNQIIEGMKNAGTLDLFRNGMPSLKQLCTNGKRLRGFTDHDKNRLCSPLMLYAIVYFRDVSQDQLEGLIYGGRTINGWERFNEHEGNITSKSLSSKPSVTTRRPRTSDYVIASVEIMCDENAVHPHYYLPLPDVDPFDAWAHARKIAVRVGYKDDDGNTCMRYLRPRRIFSFYENLDSNHGTLEEVFCLERDWACMMSIFAAFMWDWKDHPKGLRSSLIAPWYIQLRSVEYDLFTQTTAVEKPVKK
ncbi:hypothetical protein LZ32DRAFT_653687 [Colletotrichum eremochloae]|nr:hypothetical protein LZ32DRAFT_653687 [Colletotrichum eremochloae]